MAPPFTLNVTEAAATEIKKFMSSEGLPEAQGFASESCRADVPAFNTANIEEESRDGDQITEAHGVRLFVDMFSAQYLSDVEINYVSGVMGSGFTFNNPNATGGCGCGSSFTA
jgi:iron-sulfur cluster assembly protein